MTIAVSVIIPTRNRSARLAALLSSVARADSEGVSWEVVVIDNASSDGTHAAVLAAQRVMPTALKYVLEPEPGLHACRHRGAREASGEVLAYLDDDTLVDTCWLRGARPLLRGHADAVVSRILPVWESAVPPWLQELVGSGVYGPLTLLDLGSEQREVDSGYVWGAGFFIRRALVFELDGFNPDSMPAELLKFRGDGETGLMRKFAAAGRTALYDPSSTVAHCVPTARMTSSYLFERAFRQGISDSFSALRIELGVAPREASASGGESAARDSSTRWQDHASSTAARALRKAAVRIRGRLTPKTAGNRAKASFDSASRAASISGWDYHRRAVEADPALLRWVSRTSYLDAVLADYVG